MTKRYVFVGLLLFSVQCTHGQAYGELDLNDVRFRMYSDGYAGARVNPLLLPTMEVPINSGTRVLYGSGIWLAGVDPGANLHIAGWLYGASPSGGDFFPGPLRSDGTASSTQAISDAYDHVWVVTRQQIIEHLAYYSCLADPNCNVGVEYPNGYTIPTEFMDWPAHGDVNDGYDLYLAPFYDFDLDGVYNAQNGDAPCILGDQAFFLVFNDNLGPHGESLGLPLGIEVQLMGFVYNGSDPALDQTVFLRYHLINRSNSTYEDFHIGYFNDIDVGCANDDFFGTDPSRNLQFIYNWQDVDLGCLGSIGYGDQPPAVGMTLLKGPLMDPNGTDDPVTNLVPAWNGMAFGDGNVDNERHGISYSMYFNRESPNSAITDPSQPTHWYNYLRGVWKNGTPLTYGGNGYSTAPDAILARYMFPGANDPVGAGTGGQIVPPWAETVPTPGTPDRRGVLGSGPITLDPGEHVDLLFAYVYARAGSGGAFASVTALQARVDSVRSFAETLPIWNVMEGEGFHGQCADYAFLGVQEVPILGRLTLFPSPASEQVRFNASADLVGGSITLHDALGRNVLQQRVQPGVNEIDISALSAGVYSCSVITERTRYTGRLVKE